MRRALSPRSPPRLLHQILDEKRMMKAQKPAPGIGRGAVASAILVVCGASTKPQRLLPTDHLHSGIAAQ